jgi:hypothetical protein
VSYRIKDPKAVRRKVRQDPSCRACGVQGSDGHHIVFRSKGGDDVEDNVVCLDHHCHMILHYSAHDEERHRVRAAIGKALTPEELGYAIDRLGDDAGREYMRRHYDVSRKDPRYDAPRKKRPPRGLENLDAISNL